MTENTSGGNWEESEKIEQMSRMRTHTFLRKRIFLDGVEKGVTESLFAGNATKANPLNPIPSDHFHKNCSVIGKKKNSSSILSASVQVIIALSTVEDIIA
jgi:hypothetical protein